MWQRRGEVRAWLFGIMHSHFVDRLRAQRARPEDSVGDELPEIAQRPMQGDDLALRDVDRLLHGYRPSTAKCCCSSASRSSATRRSRRCSAFRSAP